MLMEQESRYITFQQQFIYFYSVKVWKKNSSIHRSDHFDTRINFNLYNFILNQSMIIALPEA